MELVPRPLSAPDWRQLFALTIAGGILSGRGKEEGSSTAPEMELVGEGGGASVSNFARRGVCIQECRVNEALLPQILTSFVTPFGRNS